MLIVFIQNVATLIQAPHVVAGVARDLDGAIERLFPELIGEPASDEELNDASARDMESNLGENCVVVGSAREGYIQAIDADGLMHLARERDLVLRLRSQPGDFISIGSPLADVWPAAEQPAAELSGADLAVPLSETFLVGIHRTPRQDVECMIDELVEVAVRALSPGINDPFTAMNCIDRLGAALGRVAERKLPSAYRGDDEGRLRVIARPVSFANVLDAAFDQIRQYGRDSVAVTIRLLEALESISAHVQRGEDREALKLRADMILRLAESFSEEHDQREAVKQHERVMQRLNLDHFDL